jgi:hypothetical protein
MVTWTMNDKERLKNIINQNLNVRANDETFRSMRKIVLDAHEQTREKPSAVPLMSMRRLIMKISTTRIGIIGLICTSIVAAAAVGMKYHLVREDAEYGYLVASEDGRNMMNIHAADPEEAVETAEAVTLLKQQGRRRLVRMSELEVDGQLDSRTLTYEYSLPDGRTIHLGERAPDDPGAHTLTEERRREANQRWHEILKNLRMELTSDGGQRFVTADGEEIRTSERIVQGQTFIFDEYTFTLSDGTEVKWSFGKLKEAETD